MSTDTCSSSDNEALESEDEREWLFGQEAVKRRSHKQGAVDDNISHSLNKSDCQPKATEKKKTTPRKLSSHSATDDETYRRSRIKKKTCQRLHSSEGEEELERELKKLKTKKPESARNQLEHSQAMRIQLGGTLTPQNSINDAQKRLKETKERIIKNLEDSRRQLQESNEHLRRLWEDAQASRRLSWSMQPLDEEPTLQTKNQQ